MPISYEIDKASGLLWAKGVGAITEADIAAFVDALAADPEYVHRRASLVDFSEARFEVPSDRIHELASLHEKLLACVDPPTRVAVVVPGDVSFGLARMYEHYRSLSGAEVVPFRDEASAMAWLEAGGEDEET